MSNKNLEWEHKWTDKHPEYYQSKAHAEAVKQNIAVGYEIRKREAEIRDLRRSFDYTHEV